MLAQTSIYTLLAEEGYLLSRQRRIIIEELCAIRQIDDIEDFWIDVRSKYEISWATVHNTFRLLQHIGIMVRLDKPQRQTIYILCLPHQNTN